MELNIQALPGNIKLEVSKNDLVEFAKELAKELHSNQEVPLAEKDIVDLHEAILITGFAKQTLYSLTSQRKIPHFKRGKKLVFRRSELEAWMLCNRQRTVSEIESEASSRNFITQPKRKGGSDD